MGHIQICQSPFRGLIEWVLNTTPHVGLLPPPRVNRVRDVLRPCVGDQKCQTISVVALETRPKSFVSGLTHSFIARVNTEVLRVGAKRVGDGPSETGIWNRDTVRVSYYRLVQFIS